MNFELIIPAIAAVVAAWDAFRRYLIVRQSQTVEQALDAYSARMDMVHKTFLESIVDGFKLQSSQLKDAREKLAAQQYESRRRA